MMRFLKHLSSLDKIAETPRPRLGVGTVDAAITPIPAKQLPMPGPLKTNRALKPGITPKTEMKETPNIKQAFLDSGIMPLLYSALAGAGGYYTGKYIFDPLLKLREQRLQLKLMEAEEILKRMAQTRKAVPIVTSALSALVVGTLAAKKAREDERDKMWDAINRGITSQQLEGGYSPNNRVNFGTEIPYY
jgi:hypothetical protein